MKGAHEEWDRGVRVAGEGGWAQALRSWEVVRGVLEWPLSCRMRCPTSGSYRRGKANGFLSWKKPSITSSEAHQAWPAPMGP